MAKETENNASGGDPNKTPSAKAGQKPVDPDATVISEAAQQPKTIDPPATAEDVPAAPRPEVTSPPESTDTSAPIPPGTMINNNYEIKELISAGGMGEVFRGVNAFTGDAVAIKIVLNSLADDEKVAALFMREAKVLCQLSDQAIVRYYNFVKDTNLDRFCLIMEFVDGVSLSDEMREKGGLGPKECFNLIRRLAAGLGRAHEMEVVHRDLSPDNVILRNGVIDDAVLIDFGIAKSNTNVESTLHGQLAGKFKYISPEQLGHFDGEVGPRTDVYGLGLLISAVSRGEPLDMGTTVVEAVNARQEVPDLTGVHPDLVPIITHMLQPDPANRPARMSDVIAMLDSATPAPPPVSIAPVQGTLRPAALPVPGLRQPPGRTGPPSTLTGSLETSIIPESTSPFGVAPGTVAPQTMAPTAVPAPETRGRDGLILVLLLALLGGGGYFAWSQGFISANAPVTEQQGGAATEPDGAETASGNGPDPTTREGFLAMQSADACVFATRIAGGPDSGIIRAFSNDISVFGGLSAAYNEAFSAQSTIATQEIATEQCAALDLAHALRALGGTAPVLTLDSPEMKSGGSLVGRISDRRGRTVWLALVSTAGGVYNLTDRLTEQADGSATFTFGLQAEAGADPTPQLLIAIASESPLIAAAAATDGTSADTLLPLIEAEVAGREDGNVGASIGVFSLAP